MRALLVVVLVAFSTAAEPQCLIPENLIINGGPGKDGIPALTNPEVVPVDAGDTFLVPDDLVLGVLVGGEARAYPHAVLWWHEIVNDVLGGRPILVTFCPLTGSGIVFDPVLNGELHNFGVSGLLFDNNLIMFDRTTDSLWSQMRLDGICGNFRGTQQTLLPVVQSTWEAWKAMHPGTTVVSFNTGFDRNYDVYPYGDYQTNNDFLLFPHSSFDRRLPVKENVLGIRHNGLARAYSMRRMGELAPRLAINDDLNGLPVLVVFDDARDLAVPFDRTLVSSEVLDFDVVDGDGFPFELRDRQTGSTWSLDGVATSGPLAGETLRRIATYTAFWFAWASFNQGTEIYEP